VTDIAIVYALFGDRLSAEAVAGRMIEERLAACVNIQADCLSVYRWQGEVERADETPAIFKTSLDRRAALMAAQQLDRHDQPSLRLMGGRDDAGRRLTIDRVFQYPSAKARFYLTSKV
jgi:periplasmic divalent cation tolerance protein